MFTHRHSIPRPYVGHTPTKCMLSSRFLTQQRHVCGSSSEERRDGRWYRRPKSVICIGPIDRALHFFTFSTSSLTLCLIESPNPTLHTRSVCYSRVALRA